MSISRYLRSIKPFSRELFTMTSLQQSKRPSPSSPGPVEKAIREKLIELLQPTSINISNDSWQHRHHAAMRDQESNGETHFSIQVVADAFEKKTTMQRHRMIYSALSEEFAGGLHALSLQTKTPTEIASVADGK